MFCTLRARALPQIYSGVLVRFGQAVLAAFVLCVGFSAEGAPVISTQPKPAYIAVGSNHTFQVTATGIALTYQWRFNGNALAGETSAALTLSNVQTNQAGPYDVIVGDSLSSVTSAVAYLSVRLSDAPVYMPPSGGWTYVYDGSSVSNLDSAALDGTWAHNNGSDSWALDGRGPGVGAIGGVGSTNGVLTLEDDLTSGTGVDNRRFYFTRALAQDSLANANTLLNDGVTLSFRARLTPPTDPLIELANAPNGYVNALDGKGMIGLRQMGSSGSIISFSLNMASEDTNTTAVYNFPAAGLHMNNLNGSTRGPQVDPSEPGTLNLFPLDPTVFHEFWISIQDNGAVPGTHVVTIYVDGAKVATNFNVTAGSGFDLATNYLAIGLPSVIQQGAFDLDYVAYRPGVHVPMRVDEPATITSAPVNQSIAAGSTASFSASVAGTPPIHVQWYKNGEAIPGATNLSYTTPPTSALDNGAQFSMSASNISNVEMSSAATLEVIVYTPPAIVTEPQSLVVTNGDTAVFGVVASGTPPLQYQWRHNGSNLAGATTPTLMILQAGPADGGLYDVVVTNPGGSAVSSPATLTVNTFDFGDAPVPFPTALAQNGARHLLVPGIYLGGGVDYETDARPADADDGVRFATIVGLGQMAVVEVVASTDGFLNAWMDFDGDGSWAETGNQIFTNQRVATGTNQLVFLVPSNATPGSAFARFRFGTSAGLEPVGAASDGEVEDYAAPIVPVADVSVVVSDSPDPIAVGSNLIYVVTLANAGPSTASGVSVSNVVSAGANVLTAVASQGGCAHENGVVNCALGSVTAGATVSITITAQASASGELINTFYARAAESDLNLGNNSVVATTMVHVAPSITLQPASLTVTQGATVQFTVEASGTEPLEYQWLFSEAPLAGETNNTLTLASVESGDAGAYRVRVGNLVGATLSEAANLIVLVPATIVRHPANQTNLAGGTAVFQVLAAGSEPLNYQWTFNGTNLPGATNASLVISNVQLSHGGSYSVEVANAAGAVTSEAAVLEVTELDFGDAPTPFPSVLAEDGARHRLVGGFQLGASLDFEPDATTEDGDDGVLFTSAVLAGQQLAIQVVASSNGTLNAWIDWNGNGSWADASEQICTDYGVIGGTNELTFLVPATALPGERVARFRFSSAAGLSFTGEAPDGEVEDYRIAVGGSADISLQVQAQPSPVAVGSNLIYYISFTNSGPSTATSLVLTSAFPATLTVLSSASSQGSCSNVGLEVVCDFGELSSGAGGEVQVVMTPNGPGLHNASFLLNAAEVDFVPGNNSVNIGVEAFEFPQITSQPQPLTVTNGSPAVFAVSATGTAVQYQWFVNGTAIPDATNSTYNIPSAQGANAGPYRVRIANAVGEVLSAEAQLTVLDPPLIVTQPASTTVLVGETATFSVSAAGTVPLTYQWSRDEVQLLDETNSTLVITSAQLSNQGTYRVNVSNSAGEAVSDAVELTVLAPPVITTQPQSQALFAGESATLQVVANGTQPLSYQWYRDETNLVEGATASTLMFASAQKSNSGDYFVVASNQAAMVTSVVARLTVSEADFGDALGMDYGTRRVFNGAYHFITPNFRLGARIDFEPDGQPDVNAAGDDAAGEDDEDGVRFPGALLVGQSAVCEVVASTNGFLDAWIDFNGNGNWADPGEQVFTAYPLVPGTNSLLLMVPRDARAHSAVARFRFSAGGHLASSGPASEGEVEDYLVAILPAIDLRLNVYDDRDPVLVESEFELVMEVTNVGPSIATSVALQPLLPDSVTLTSINASQGSCSNSLGTVLCDLGDLAPGAMATVSIHLVPHRIGMIESRVEVYGLESEISLGSNVQTETTSIVAASELFRNSAPLDLLSGGPAATYPSTLLVSGVTGTVQKVILTLHNLSHTYPDDLDILLVGPQGQTAMVMSDAGGNNALSFLTVSFDETSELALPDNGRIVSESYRASNYGTGADAFSAPAPSGPHGVSLGAFAGTDPNGIWALYVMDDVVGEGGFLNGGWSLQFQALDPIADIAVGATATPQPVDVNESVTVMLSVTNVGPAAASRVVLTNNLMGTYTVESVGVTQGSCTNAGTQISCDFGPMNPGQTATVSLTISSATVQTMTNEVVVWGSERDFVSANNSSSMAVSVGVPPAITLQPQSLTVTNGADVVFRAAAVGTAPLSFQWLWNGVELIGATSSTLTFSNASSALNGIYSVRVSNVVTTVLSENAELIVSFPPAISDIPNLVLAEDTASAEIPFTISDVETSAEALEVVATSSNPVLVPHANILIAGSGGTRTIRIVPAPNGFGMAVVAITVRDGHGIATSDSFEVLVESRNDLPSIVGLSDQTAAEDEAVTLPFAIDDIETAAGELLVTVTSDNPRLTPVSAVVLTGTDGERTLSLTPAADEFGTAMITVRVEDADQGVVTQSFALQVIGVNDSPTATTPNAVSIDEDAGETAFALSDIGPGATNELQVIAITAEHNNSNLLANLTIKYEGGSTGLVSFSTISNAHGTATITLTFDDGSASNNVMTRIVDVTVNSINDVPVISEIADLAIVEDTATPEISFTISDVETDASTLTVDAVSSTPALIPVSGIVPGGSGNLRTLQLMPTTNASGLATITVSVRDSEGAIASETFEFSVTPLNDPPVIAAFTNQAMSEDGELVLSFNISDVETPAELLTLSVDSNNTNLIGSSALIVAGAGADRTLTIRPATNEHGLAVITVTVVDTNAAATTRSFEVLVQPVNDPPTLDQLVDLRIEEDSGTHSVPLTDIGSGAINETEPLAVSATVSPQNLLSNIVVRYSGGATGTLSFVTLPDSSGTATIIVEVNDGAPTNNVVSRSFTVTVSGVNDPPVLAEIFPQQTREDVPITVLLAVSDVESAAELLSVTAQSANTNLVDAAGISISNAVVTLVPRIDEFGTTMITVSVRDSSNAVATQTFELTVAPVNDAPTLDALGDLTISEDAALQTMVLTNLTSGASNEAQSLQVSATSSNPGVIPDPVVTFLNSNKQGTLTLAPMPNASGSAIITVTVDDLGLSNNITSRTFVVNVEPINDLPAISQILNQATLESTPLNIDFAVNDLETAATALQVSATSDNAELLPAGSLVVAGTDRARTLQITPASNRSGIATVTLIVTDLESGSASSSFVLTVVGMNDTPMITDIPDLLLAEDTASEAVTFNVSDADTPAESLQIVARSSNPSVIPNTGILLGGTGPSRTILVTPASNRSGSATITVTVRDTDGSSASDSFLVEVQPVNDAPAISAIPEVSVEVNGSLPVPFTVSDHETAFSNLVVTAVSSNPSLISDAGLILSGSGPNRSLMIIPVSDQIGTAEITLSATDEDGSTTTELFAVHVVTALQPVLITAQPQSQTIASGATLTLSVSATGTAPITYQWAFNGSLVENATNATFTIANAQLANSGSYLAIVSNRGGAVTSSVAVVTIATAPNSTPPTIGDISNQLTAEDTPLAVPFVVFDPDTPVHFLTITATSTNSVLLPPTNLVINGVGVDRVLSIIPEVNASGTSLITVTVSDGFSSVSDSFLLTVNAVNDPPTLDFIANVSAVERGTSTVPLTGIGSGSPGEIGNVTIVAASSDTAIVPHPTVNYTSGASTGSLLFRPPNNSLGTATITVTVDDGQATSVRTFTVFVRSTSNANPTISGSTFGGIGEDTSSGEVPFAIGDTTTPAALLSFSASSANTELLPQSGIFIGGSGSTRTLMFVPAPNRSGIATIHVSVTDAAFGFASTTFTLAVFPENDPPTITAIGDQTIDEDTATALLAFAIGDVETYSAALNIIASSSNPSLIPNANITIGGSGSNRVIMAAPLPNQTGLAVIQLLVTDPEAASAMTSFTVNVSAQNDLPQISDVPDITIDPGSSSGALSFAVSDVETVAANLTIQVSSSDETLVPLPGIMLSGSGTDRTIIVTPAPDRAGTAAITLTVSDGDGGTASDSFLVYVADPGTNAPPTLDPLADMVINEGSGPHTVLLTGIGPTSNGRLLAVSAVSSHPDVLPHPVVNYAWPASTGSLLLTPHSATNGAVQVVVSVSDGSNIVSRTFNVTVRAFPVISVIGDVMIPEDTSSAPLAFTVGDAETAATNLQVTATSSNPALIPNINIALGGDGVDRTVTVTPLPHEFGTAMIDVTVSDGDGMSATSTFAIAVTAVNDAPTLDPISDHVLAEGQTAHTINLSGLSSGAPNEVQSLMIVASSSNPAFVPSPMVAYTSPSSTGALTFVPVADVRGRAEITVTVTDGQLTNQFFSRRFNIASSYIENPPTLDVIADVAVDEDSGARTMILTGIGPGVDNELQTVTLSATSSDSAIVPHPSIVYTNGEGSALLSFAPATNAFGSVLVTVSVNDGVSTTTQTFTITVNSRPEFVSLSKVPDQAANEDQMLGPLDLRVIDDSGGTNVTISAQSSNPILFSSEGILLTGTGADRFLTLRPNTNQFGSATITLTATLPTGEMDSNAFLVVVHPVNDPPRISAIADQLIDEDTATAPIVVGLADVETLASAITLVVTSSNPALIPDSNLTITATESNRLLVAAPLPNQSGTTVIQVSASDADSGTATITFNITVREVNDPPYISDILDVTIFADTASAPLPFTISDLETDSAALVISAESSDETLIGLSGLVISPGESNRTVVITPAPERFGSATITLTVSDGAGASVSDSFLVRVTTNTPPTLNALPDLTINEGSGAQTVALTGITGGLGDPNQILKVSAISSNSDIVPHPTVSYVSPATAGTLTFAPNPGANGSVEITVTVDDQHQTNNLFSRTFTVIINPVDNPPTLDPISDRIVEEDSGTHTLVVTGIGPGDTNEQQVLSITAASSDPSIVPHPSVAYTNGLPSAVLSFTPALNATGTVMLTVSLTDGLNLVTESFSVTVNPRAEVLVISQIADQLVDEDQVLGPLSFMVDDDSRGTNITLSAQSSDPTLIPLDGITLAGTAAERAITIRPAANQSGTATITLTASVPTGESVTSSFIVVVNPMNDLPQFLLSVSNQSVSEDGSITVPFIIGDMETPAADLVLERATSDGLLLPETTITFGGSDSNRTVTVSPPPDLNGTVAVEIRIRDAAGDYATNQFIVTILPVDDPPTIGAIGDRYIFEDQETQVPFTIHDADGPGTALGVTVQSSDTRLLGSSDIVVLGRDALRILRITPKPDRNGLALVTVTVRDETGLESSRAFAVGVIAVNDPPSISALPNMETTLNAPIDPLSFQVSDIENFADQLSLRSSCSDTNLIPLENILFMGDSTNRLVTLIPATNSSGFAIVTLEVTDANGATSTTQFEVIVHQTNGPPAIALQPESQSVFSGTVVQLRAIATGPGPLTYQWRRNGMEILGGTNSALTFTSVQRRDSGDYQLIVSNSAGAVTSVTATLDVEDPDLVLNIGLVGNTVQLSFQAALDRRYTVEYRDALDSSSWIPLNTLDGTGTLVRLTDPTPSGPIRFYRVRIE